MPFLNLVNQFQVKFDFYMLVTSWYLFFNPSLKMGKKTSIVAEKRAQINLLSEEGYSEHQISIRIGVSKTAVHQAIAKFQKYDIYTDRKKSERPLKTSSRDDHIIKKVFGLVCKLLNQNSCLIDMIPWID